MKYFRQTRLNTVHLKEFLMNKNLNILDLKESLLKK